MRDKLSSLHFFHSDLEQAALPGGEPTCFLVFPQALPGERVTNLEARLTGAEL